MTTGAPSPSWPQADILDLDHLARQTMGDKEVEREVAGLFLDQTARVLRLIREAEQARQRSDAAHQLKGSARAVGAWRVAAAAERVERLAPDTSAESFLEVMADLHASVAEARAAIAAVIGESSPGGL